MINDILQHLHNNGVGVIATNLFATNLPPDPSNAICVLDTGGLAPDTELPIDEPTFQVFIRNENYANGKTKLDAVRNLLHRRMNQTLVPNGTYFYFIYAIAQGAHVGKDENQCDLFSINFRCRTR